MTRELDPSMPLLVLLPTIWDDRFCSRSSQICRGLLGFTAPVTLAKGPGRMGGESWKHRLVLPGGRVCSHAAGKEGRAEFSEMDEIGTLGIKLEKNMSETCPGDRKGERERRPEWCE